MRNLPAPVLPSAMQRQLNMPLDPRLQWLTPSERRIALARLASILRRRPASRQGSATMTSADLLPAAVLKRKAVVYVRQSTQA